MEEKSIKTVYKALNFEKSGETLSVTINLENVSPAISKETIIGIFDDLYYQAKKEII